MEPKNQTCVRPNRAGIPLDKAHENDIRILNIIKQEDARRRLRGMCWCKKELPLRWMAMESLVVYATKVCRRDGDVIHLKMSYTQGFLCYSKQNLHQYYHHIFWEFGVVH